VVIHIDERHPASSAVCKASIGRIPLNRAFGFQSQRGQARLAGGQFLGTRLVFSEAAELIVAGLEHQQIGQFRAARG
jgi:hypothetical protein